MQRYEYGSLCISCLFTIFLYKFFRVSTAAENHRKTDFALACNLKFTSKRSEVLQPLNRNQYLVATQEPERVWRVVACEYRLSNNLETVFAYE